MSDLALQGSLVVFIMNCFETLLEGLCLKIVNTKDDIISGQSEHQFMNTAELEVTKILHAQLN